MKNNLTISFRHCSTCGYFCDMGYKEGWCSWIGTMRKARQQECEDGYKEKD